jgi:hypothetical protein
MRKLMLIFILASIYVFTYAQSANPFTGVPWQGRITYKEENN